MFSLKIVYNTRPKIKEHILVVMDEPLHEESLSQPLEIKNKELKNAVNFSTG